MGNSWRVDESVGVRRKQWRSIWGDDFRYHDVERIKQEASVCDKKWLG